MDFILSDFGCRLYVHWGFSCFVQGASQCILSSCLVDAKTGSDLSCITICLTTDVAFTIWQLLLVAVMKTETTCRMLSMMGTMICNRLIQCFEDHNFDDMLLYS